MTRSLLEVRSEGFAKDFMILVPKAQAGQVQYLLEQSMRGHHLLFDAEVLRNALIVTPLSEEETYAVEPHLERLMSQPTLERKQSYLQELYSRDPHTVRKIVQTYFSIIENTILEATEEKH